jgi:FdrA protein
MPERDATGFKRLLAGDLAVVNVGLEGFAADLAACGIKVIHVDWVPPAGGDPKMAALLARLGV